MDVCGTEMLQRGQRRLLTNYMPYFLASVTMLHCLNPTYKELLLLPTQAVCPCTLSMLVRRVDCNLRVVRAN